ncbi:MAG TPA: transcriptional repressor [Burkholderiales bacterium]|nr:transcriptional repressor [Pseudomonadota bacterium]HVC49947.1 transcriptional repressor [Burkholderiales bacterium]
MIEITCSRESVPALLRAHDITPTHQRIEIAYALFSRGEHLSADQVLSAVNQSHSETSKATVYNTLNLFVRNQLIREVIVDPNKVFYDPNTMEHHHFYDVVNGRLYDVDAQEISVQGLPCLPAGMEAEGIEIVIRIRPKSQ